MVNLSHSGVEFIVSNGGPVDRFLVRHRFCSYWIVLSVHALVIIGSSVIISGRVGRRRSLRSQGVGDRRVGDGGVRVV